MNEQNFITKEYLQTFIQNSVTVWQTKAYKRHAGGMYEGLDFGLLPRSDLIARVRILPRNIFSFCYAQYHGYEVDLAKPVELAKHLYKQHFDKTRGYVSRANDSTSPIYTYDHAFVLLAYAWLYLVTGDKNYKESLKETAELMSKNLRTDDGSFLVSDEASKSNQRDQNPHMHLLEACMQSYLITGDEFFKDWSKEIFFLCERHFVKPVIIKQKNSKENRTYQVLVEFMDDNWQAREDAGMTIEPGHHFEWVWLLDTYYNVIENSNKVIELMDSLYSSAAAFGLSEAGFGYDGLEVTKTDSSPAFESAQIPQGLATIQIKTPTHRLWVQTEYLKALMSLSTRQNKLDLMDKARETLAKIASNYFLDQRALWYDRINDNGSNVSLYCPSSMLYHVLIAAQEALYKLF